MPYFIAVLALVVVGVGFTFFQSHNTLSEAVPLVAESVPTETLSAPEAQNSDDDEEDESEEKDDNDEGEEEDDTTSATPTVADIPVIETAPIVADVTPPPPTPKAQTTYTNGTYNTQATYKTPDRDTYTMDVTLTVADDVITAANVSFDAKALRDGYVKRFANAYQSQVIGESLEGISLSRVAGASLTTKAFNNALETIKNQAV